MGKMADCLSPSRNILWQDMTLLFNISHDCSLINTDNDSLSTTSVPTIFLRSGLNPKDGINQLKRKEQSTIFKMSSQHCKLDKHFKRIRVKPEAK